MAVYLRNLGRIQKARSLSLSLALFGRAVTMEDFQTRLVPSLTGKWRRIALSRACSSTKNPSQTLLGQHNKEKAVLPTPPIQQISTFQLKTFLPLQTESSVCLLLAYVCMCLHGGENHGGVAKAESMYINLLASQ